MRRFLAAVLLLSGLVVCAPAIAAEHGVYLAWDDCGAAGQSSRSFACDTNAGTDELVVSFRPYADGDLFEFHGEVIITPTAGTGFPDWWKFAAGTGCRAGGVTASTAFGPGYEACSDPWVGQGFQVVSSAPWYGKFVVRVDVSLPHAAAVPLDENTEYYAFRLRINHRRTVGAGACAGCEIPVCLGAHYMSYVVNPADPVSRTLFVGNNHLAVAWNGGSACDRSVPAQNRTWGAIKTLYR